MVLILNGSSLKRTLGWSIMTQECLIITLISLSLNAPAVMKEVAACLVAGASAEAAVAMASPVTCYSMKEDRRDLSRSLFKKTMSSQSKNPVLKFISMRKRRNTLSLLTTRMESLMKHQTRSTNRFMKIMQNSLLKTISILKSSLTLLKKSSLTLPLSLQIAM